MEQNKYHVAKTGKQAGQLVRCTAQQSCRNRGKHILDRELNAIRAWKKDDEDTTPVTKHDLKYFQKLTTADQTYWTLEGIEQTRKPTVGETFRAKAKSLKKVIQSITYELPPLPDASSFQSPHDHHRNGPHTRSGSDSGY
jgi:hypothetical protein